MKHIFKLFGDRDTDSTNKSFVQARFRLSILYTIVFGLLVILFSAGLYYLFAADIHEDMSSVFPEKSEQVRIINQHKSKLLYIMLIIDGCMLIFISGASFYLAGKTLHPIQKNYEAQKNFIADASHELRTPIAILKADLEVNIQDNKITPTIKKLFKSYLEEVDQMKVIVENLLTLFRFDSNQMHVEKKCIDLNTLLTKSTNSLRSYAQRKKVKLQLVNDAQVRVLGDALLLQQAYRNILKNAIEYSENGAIVSIHLMGTRQRASIEVNNKGAVIPKEMIGHVFDRFYRTDASKKKRSEGVGLGLPISKYIIEKHLGSLSIASTAQKGTTVQFLLPTL